jgi:hypothetical protein
MLAYAFWLNQIEIWVPILQGQCLSGASFTALGRLLAHIDPFYPHLQSNGRMLDVDKK